MASLGLSSGFPGTSHHSDVLSASPESADDKRHLVDEIKRRGRAAVGAKNYPDADVLYGKGIDVLLDLISSGDDEAKKDVAILYSNRSLARLQLNKTDDARSDAAHATEHDPSYVKGYWRLGQALSALARQPEALDAFESALKLDPDNKALKKEVAKVRERIEKDAKLVESAEAMDIDEGGNNKTDKQQPVKTTAKKTAEKKITTTTTKGHTSEEKKSEASATGVGGDDDDGLFSKSDHVRGYKIRADGKKTSYFHRDQTEEEKRLIGDIAPKRLGPSTAGGAGGPAPIAPAVAAAEGRSAWNTAGTWEERDVTSWAKDTLTASLLSAEYVLPEGSPDPNARCAVSKVDGFTGHASYATVRGKKRYIYEFGFTVHWVVHLGRGDSCHGKMSFPDVDGTVELGEGYDMVGYEVEGGAPGDARHLLERFVRDGGLRDSIHKKMDEWVELFRATY